MFGDAHDVENPTDDLWWDVCGGPPVKRLHPRIMTDDEASELRAVQNAICDARFLKDRHRFEVFWQRLPKTTDGVYVRNLRMSETYYTPCEYMAAMAKELWEGIDAPVIQHDDHAELSWRQGDGTWPYTPARFAGERTLTVGNRTIDMDYVFDYVFECVVEDINSFRTGTAYEVGERLQDLKEYLDRFSFDDYAKEKLDIIIKEADPWFFKYPGPYPYGMLKNKPQRS